MCAGKAGSGNLNSKSVLASGRPLDEEMQVLAVERESTPESQVHRSGKGWGGPTLGSGTMQTQLWIICEPSPGTILGYITSLLFTSLRFCTLPSVFLSQILASELGRS